MNKVLAVLNPKWTLQYGRVGIHNGPTIPYHYGMVENFPYHYDMAIFTIMVSTMDTRNAIILSYLMRRGNSHTAEVSYSRK